MTIRLRVLKPEELPSIFPLTKEANPGMTRARFTALLKGMVSGYQCLAAFEGESMVAVSGFSIFNRFWCGKQLDIDNVIVTKTHRGRGIGEKMLRWLETHAAREQCDIIVLDAYSHNTASHRFYHREGYTIRGYHFTKDLA